MALENQWFLEKWANYLQLTISYDFIFQEENREAFDVDAVGKLCQELGIAIMWQFVVPITDPRAFSLPLAHDIIEKTKYSKKPMVNLIPLRHHRGADKFQDFFGDIDMYKFSEDFLRFINVLYNYNVHVLIDGAYKKVDKNYTGKHNKIILSPDGYIYPEFDFCEYQTAEFRVGQWHDRNSVQFVGKKGLEFVPVFYEEEPNKEDSLIPTKCLNCDVREECGIKYLYKLFDHEPGSRCALFYNIVNNAINYVTRLNTREHFYNWVFPMNEQQPIYDPAAKFVPANGDYRSHFIKADNVLAAKQEVVFSLLRRYNCFANCEVCYVDKHFEKDKSRFSRFIPTDISKEMTERWMNVFEGYYCVSTNDDMFFLKHNHPTLFKWYQQHSELFYLGSVTDNALVRSYDILMNDLTSPKGIYEITLSDKWLTKVNFKKILGMLDNLHRKLTIKFVKYIITDKASLDWSTTRELRAFLDANGIQISLHHDFHKNTILIEEGTQNLSFSSFNGDLFTICGEADYLQYDSFFLTQVEAIDPTVQPYDVIDDDFTFTRHLSRHLHGKKDVYTRFYNRLRLATDEYNIRFREYYKYVIDNLVVNDDYSYIPDLAVTTYEKLYSKLVSEGWQQTPLGLLNLERNPTVVPLFQFK